MWWELVDVDSWGCFLLRHNIKKLKYLGLVLSCLAAFPASTPPPTTIGLENVPTWNHLSISSINDARPAVISICYICFGNCRSFALPLLWWIYYDTGFFLWPMFSLRILHIVKCDLQNHEWQGSNAIYCACIYCINCSWPDIPNIFVSVLYLLFMIAWYALMFWTLDYGRCILSPALWDFWGMIFCYS